MRLLLWALLAGWAAALRLPLLDAAVLRRDAPAEPQRLEPGAAAALADGTELLLRFSAEPLRSRRAPLLWGTAGAKYNGATLRLHAGNVSSGLLSLPLARAALVAAPMPDDGEWTAADATWVSAPSQPFFRSAQAVARGDGEVIFDITDLVSVVQRGRADTLVLRVAVAGEAASLDVALASSETQDAPRVRTFSVSWLQGVVVVRAAGLVRLFWLHTINTFTIGERACGVVLWVAVGAGVVGAAAWGALRWTSGGSSGKRKGD